MRHHVIFGSTLILALALQASLRHKTGTGRQASRYQPELLYISSGDTLRRLSLGFDGLLADIYWTRAVQYYGRERLTPHPDYSELGPLLGITTSLDPHLLVAYQFGAMFLAAKPPDGAGQPEQAMQLLRRGIVANPAYWRFWQSLGFIQYWDLHDYAAAARTFKTGSERPGAEIWMKALAASVAAKGGEMRTSQLLWGQIYRTASNAAIRKSAADHLAALEAYEDLHTIDRLADVYRRREGRAARSMQDLVAIGLLRAVPLDPSGLPYRLTPESKAALSPDSHIKLELLQ